LRLSFNVGLSQNGFVDAEEIVDVVTAVLKGAQKKTRERRKGAVLLVKALAMLERPLENLIHQDKALGEAKIQELGDILLTIGQVACQHKNWSKFLVAVTIFPDK
jgi:hypothetical protein